MTAASDKDYIDKGYINRGYFTEADSAEVVIGRNDPTRNPRLAEVMAVIVRHSSIPMTRISHPTPSSA
jgi:hypothetical protein